MKIKTVDWFNTLDADLVAAVGGASALGLPPDWFARIPLGNGGLISQAGVAPQSGVSNGPGIPVSPPAAYVILNHAVRPIFADEVDTLQDETLDSTAPLLNAVVATEGWLRRFNVQDDQLNGFWVELHKTPKLHGETA